MSMLDVARFLSYSNSIEYSTDRERSFNLSMVHSGHLFSCLYGDRLHWCFGREQDRRNENISRFGKES